MPCSSDERAVLQRFSDLTHLYLYKQRNKLGIFVNLRALTVFFWVCLIASAAIAGEQKETHIKIVTDDADGEFEWHSSDPDADFSDLEVGDSKTITGDGGKDVTVTRTEEGFEFDVDGKKIELMEFMDDGNVTVDIDVVHDGDGKHMVHTIHEDGDVIIEKSKQVRIIKTDDAADVTIISSDEIDDETRSKIEAALKDAGKDGEILFIDGSELGDDAQAHGEHDVRIIKKKVEKTN